MKSRESSSKGCPNKRRRYLSLIFHFHFSTSLSSSTCFFSPPPSSFSLLSLLSLIIYVYVTNQTNTGFRKRLPSHVRMTHIQKLTSHGRHNPPSSLCHIFHKDVSSRPSLMKILHSSGCQQYFEVVLTAINGLISLLHASSEEGLAIYQIHGQQRGC